VTEEGSAKPLSRTATGGVGEKKAAKKKQKAAAAVANIRATAARRQGLTLVHFSAQLEPFLAQNAPETPPHTPKTTRKQPPE
jgi:hypothetical protein